MSLSRVLRCCLVTLAVWCVVVARASAALTRLPSDEQWSDENEAQQEVANVYDDDLYEQAIIEDLDPIEEDNAAAESDYDDEEYDFADIMKLGFRRVKDAQEQRDCVPHILSKLFDLEEDLCAFEYDKENDEEEEEEEEVDDYLNFET